MTTSLPLVYPSKCYNGDDERRMLSRPRNLECFSVCKQARRKAIFLQYLTPRSYHLSPSPRDLNHKTFIVPQLRSISTARDGPYEKFYSYTGGRWLWDEASRLRERYTKFNVPELERLTAKVVGAKSCVAMIKLAEGSFNKVFRLTMDDGRSAIARLPNENAGPRYYTTASEVATMDFARTILHIPVPKVYSWSATSENPVGAEYIIMEEAVGEQAEGFWEHAELEERVKIMKDLMSLETQMLSMSFNAFGSLYYTFDAPDGSVPAKVSGDVSEKVRREVSGRFAIGPSVDRRFWGGERAYMNLDRGPWTSAHEYISAIARSEIAWLEDHAVAANPANSDVRSAAQSAPDEHVKLLQNYLSVAPYLLPKASELLVPHLWHQDLHAGNLFIKDGNITSIIDWQSVWAGPLFLQARHPKLLDYHGEILLELPDGFKSLTDENEKSKIIKQVASSIILHLYESYTSKRNPLLHKVFRTSQGKTRSDPITFAGNTWDDDILPFRESLIRVERYWDAFKENISCPIHFTEEEIQAHERDSEGWNDVQDFWASVSHLVEPDGWTSNETYEEAAEMFSELREAGLSSDMAAKDKALFDIQTRWAQRTRPPP